ncbi:T9SS type A sorting domain-containing protein [Candidatus Cloacimonadota bacterium]
MKKFAIIFLVFIVSYTFLSANDYGMMYIDSGSGTSANLSSSAWHIVGDGTDSDFVGGSYINGHVSYNASSNRLSITTTAAEDYFVKFSLSFEGDTGADYLIGIATNNGSSTTDPDALTDPILTKRYTSGRDVGNVTASGIIQVNGTIHLYLEVKPNAEADFKPVHAQVVAVKVSELTSNPCYAQLYTSGNTTAQSLTSSMTKMKYIDTAPTDYLNGWQRTTAATDTYELEENAGIAGKYLAIISASFKRTGAANAVIAEFALAINNSIQNQVKMSRKVNNADDTGNAVTCGIIDISSSDNVSFWGSTSSNISLILEYCSIVLVKLDGSDQTASYGKIKSSNSAQSLTVNTWSDVSGFSSTSCNCDWDISSNSLEPQDGSAGYYFVDYYAGFSYTAITTDINIMFDLFKAGAQMDNLMSKRTLQDEKKTNDVGSSSSVGIAKVTTYDDLLGLRINNLTTSDDITIVYSGVTAIEMKTISDGPLPVTLSDFSASYSKNSAVLNWVTESETDNLGFNLYRSENSNGYEDNDYIQINATLIEGMGTTSQPTNYSFADEYPNIEGHTYWYWLQSVSVINELELYGPVSIEIPITGQLPSMTILETNYPNPFNPETKIAFSVKEDETAKLEIFNLRGQKILQEEFESGFHQYNWNAEGMSSGVYFYKLTSPTTNITKKMLLMK